MNRSNDRTKRNGFKVKKGEIKLDIRRKLFDQRVVRLWNMLPIEVVDAPSLEVFKTRMAGAIGGLI